MSLSIRFTLQLSARLLLGLGAVAVGSVLNNGEKIVSRSGDRVVVQDDTGELRVLKDDNALLRRPGDEVQTQTFDDGSTRTIVTKSDGSRVETIRSRDGTVLRRTNFDAQGREYVLVDDLVEEREVVVNDLPQVQQTQQAHFVQTIERNGCVFDRKLYRISFPTGVAGSEPD